MKWWKHIFSISDNKALSARHAVENRIRAVCVRGKQTKDDVSRLQALSTG